MNSVEEQVEMPGKASKQMIFLRGIIMLLLGIGIFFKPAYSLWWITMLVGALVIIDGALTLYSSLRIRHEVRVIMIVDAIFLILLGIFAIISPLLMDVVWVMLIGIWEILTGLQSIFMRRKPDQCIMPMISGIISVLIGLFFLALPIAGLLTLSWLIGIVLIAGAVSCFITVWRA